MTHRKAVSEVIVESELDHRWFIDIKVKFVTWLSRTDFPDTCRVRVYAIVSLIRLISGVCEPSYAGMNIRGYEGIISGVTSGINIRNTRV